MELANGVQRATVKSLATSVTRVFRSDLLKIITGNKLTLVGLVIIISFVVIAIFAPLIATHDPLKPQGALGFSRPGTDAFFGTDQLGRDMFSRVVFATRISLVIPVVSVLFAVVVGGSLALFSGYFGGIWDNIIGRLMDVVFGFPFLIFVIFTASVLGPGLRNTTFTLGIVFAPVLFRVVRGLVLAEKEREYVTAIRAIGASTWRILLRHIAPNVAPPLIIQATVSLAVAILIEAAVSFLGLGTAATNPSWGMLLADARNVLEKAPWASIAPGIAIMLMVLGFNMIGDGLRDILDPRMRRQLGTRKKS